MLASLTIGGPMRHAGFLFLSVLFILLSLPPGRVGLSSM
jgi:hypothetical protein